MADGGVSPDLAGAVPQENMDPSKRNSVKVILVGDSAVGKSRLVERFLMDEYTPIEDSTVALTLYSRDAEVDGASYKIDFWDSAGQERFEELHPIYYYGAHCCILVFDVKRQQTYVNLPQWFGKMRDYCGDIPCIVVANKIDLDYKMASMKFKFPLKHKLPFYFVSASDGTNVVRVFNEAIALGVATKNNPPEDLFSLVNELLEEEGFDLSDDGSIDIEGDDAT